MPMSLYAALQLILKGEMPSLRARSGRRPSDNYAVGAGEHPAMSRQLTRGKEEEKPVVVGSTRPPVRRARPSSFLATKNWCNSGILFPTLARSSRRQNTEAMQRKKRSFWRRHALATAAQRLSQMAAHSIAPVYPSSMQKAPSAQNWLS